MKNLDDTIVRSADEDSERSSSTTDLKSIEVDQHRINALRTAPLRAGSSLVTNRLRRHPDAPVSATQTQIKFKPSNIPTYSILPPRVSRIRTPTLHPIQEWEGRVTEIRDNEFDAILLDLTGDVAPDREIATILLEEVGAEDRRLMQIGAIFRWVIGYERSVGGTRRRVSQIVFLDPPELTDRDLKKGREWAAWLRESWDVE